VKNGTILICDSEMKLGDKMFEICPFDEKQELECDTIHPNGCKDCKFYKESEGEK
jgi:hypothetical protein